MVKKSKRPTRVQAGVSEQAEQRRTIDEIDQSMRKIAKTMQQLPSEFHAMAIAEYEYLNEHLMSAAQVAAEISTQSRSGKSLRISIPAKVVTPLSTLVGTHLYLTLMLRGYPLSTEVTGIRIAALLMAAIEEAMIQAHREDHDGEFRVATLASLMELLHLAVIPAQSDKEVAGAPPQEAF